ncbi:GTPase [Calidifontibacter indicus]|uniref:GTPase n=1 Tax=Calidifontibacter indicus TaxID=419650 RepID=UPI003D70E7DF
MEHEADQLLADAVADAVGTGTRALDELEVLVSGVVERLQCSAARLAEQGTAPEQALADLDLLTSRAADALLDRVGASRGLLGTFNIAFFGRTGAGKSTLMSALGRLDGSRVSPGYSDWTTDVDAIDWNGCRLYDTPGTGGWGRTRQRSTLEEEARKAVETADVVLLCFDSQSQQQAEFEKVAAWVQEYGKPAIAVLNFRNDRWRHPRRTQDRESRHALSTTLRQHVENINAELGRIGLPEVPVVAIHSKRALVARAAQPFRGPDAKAVQGELDRFGPDYLERWSNIRSLEQLLTACLIVGGADLRLASLREGLRSTFSEWAETLSDVVDQTAEQTAVLERSIGQILQVVGYPNPEHRDQLRADEDPQATDLLSKLEEARGVPFDARVTGRLETHCRHLLQSHLGEERARSLRRAEDAITNAFEDRRELEKQDFERAVYRIESVAAAIERVATEMDSYLSRNLQLTRLEGEVDLEVVRSRAIRVEGHAGRGSRRLGLTLEGGGFVAGGASAALGAIALTNAWNPAGWTAAAILGGLSIVSALANFLGRRSRREGEVQRVKARATAIGEARKAVSEQFDAWEAAQLRAFTVQAREGVAPRLRDLLSAALFNRAAERELTDTSVFLDQAANAVPASPSSVTVIAKGVELVTGQAAGSEPEVLLGEDWIEHEIDPEERTFLSKGEKAAFRRKRELDQTRLESHLHVAVGQIDADAIRKWLSAVSEVDWLSDEQKATVKALATYAHRPRIAFLGDYSAGKSSLVKRLLAEAGEAIPDALTVHAGPTTSVATTYPVGPVDLIDLPGFQGHDRDHDEVAIDEVTAAGLVVIVVNTNLLLGNTTALDEVLGGSARSSAKAGRSLFVIGRIDDIGVDPEDAPRDFLSRRRRKEAELLSALDAHGYTIESDQIFSLAADPYGMIGDRKDVDRSSYIERHRSWDGVGVIVDTVLGMSADRALRIAAAGDLDAVVGLLGVTREAQNRAMTDLKRELVDARLLAGLYQDALAELRLLTLALQRRCELLVADHAHEMVGEALGAGPSEAQATAAGLEEWWADPRLEVAVDSFYESASIEYAKWSAEHSSAIDRNLARIQSRANLGAGSLSNTDLGGGDQLAKRVLKESSRIVSAFGSREPIYKIGKAFGFKFKPWGAVKGGARVAKAGAVLGVVAVVWDVVSFVRDLNAEDGREAARRRAVQHVHDTASEIVEKILRGEEKGSGLLDHLEAQESALAEMSRELVNRQSELSADTERLRSHGDAVKHYLDVARDLDPRRPKEKV